MSEDNKKQDSIAQEVLKSTAVKNFTRDAFTIAAGKSSWISKGLRIGIKAGELVVGESYQFVKDRVGSERLLGAAAGAKAGGTLGVVLGPKGVIVAGTVGAVGGFLLGKKAVQWYEQDDVKIPDKSADTSNDNKEGVLPAPVYDDPRSPRIIEIEPNADGSLPPPNPLPPESPQLVGIEDDTPVERISFDPPKPRDSSP